MMGGKTPFDARIIHEIPPAGRKAGGEGGVHHAIRIELVVEREALGVAGIRDRLVEVGAWREMERRVGGLTPGAARRAADVLARIELKAVGREGLGLGVGGIAVASLAAI